MSTLSKAQLALMNEPGWREEVARRVADIAASVGDREIAHSMEDKLYRDVLIVIASGASHPNALAKAVLAASEIDYPRWMA